MYTVLRFEFYQAKHSNPYAIQDELKIRAVGKIGQRVGFGQIVHGNLLLPPQGFGPEAKTRGGT